MAQPATSIFSGEELEQNLCAISHISTLSGGEGGKVGIDKLELVVRLE